MPLGIRIPYDLSFECHDPTTRIILPVTYSFSGNLFRMDMEGGYSTEDIKQTFLRALADREFPDDARFLFDVSRSDVLSKRDPEQVRQVAQFLAASSERFGQRAAILTSQPAQYGRHTCVIRGTGEIACWGEGEYGCLGNGSTGVHDAPVPVLLP